MVSIEQNQKSPVSSSSDFEEDVKLKVENSLNIYPLKEGKTIINGLGEADFMLDMDDSVTEIDVNDSTVRKTHCVLNKLEAKAYVQPMNGSIQINNRVYEPGIGEIELCSGDFLIVGDSYLFQYQNPTDNKPTGAQPKGQINLVKLFKMLLLDAGENNRGEKEMMLKVLFLLSYLKSVPTKFENSYLKERLKKSEAQLEELREQLEKANQQIENNNKEMNRLKEASLVKNGGNYDSFEENGDVEEDEDRQMKEIVEQFEVFVRN